MQQTTYNDEVRLRDNANLEAFKKLLEAPETKSVALHKSGSIVEMSDGTKYKVNDNGCWIKI